MEGSGESRRPGLGAPGATCLLWMGRAAARAPCAWGHVSAEDGESRWPGLRAPGATCLPSMSRRQAQGPRVDAGSPSRHDSGSEGDGTKAVRPGFQFTSVSLICPLIRLHVEKAVAPHSSIWPGEFHIGHGVAKSRTRLHMSAVDGESRGQGSVRLGPRVC